MSTSSVAMHCHLPTPRLPINSLAAQQYRKGILSRILRSYGRGTRDLGVLPNTDAADRHRRHARAGSSKHAVRAPLAGPRRPPSGMRRRSSFWSRLTSNVCRCETCSGRSNMVTSWSRGRPQSRQPRLADINARAMRVLGWQMLSSKLFHSAMPLNKASPVPLERCHTPLRGYSDQRPYGLI